LTPAAQVDPRPSRLATMAVDELRRQKILLPPAKVLELLVQQASARAERLRALLQSAGEGRAAGRRSSERFRQAVSSSSRSLTNRTASEITQAPSPKARSTMRASPQMSRVMLKAPAWPLRSARITSKPLIVA